MVNGKGYKLDTEKVRYDLCPAIPQHEYARVWTFGAKKYASNAWMEGMDWSRVIGAAERHLYAIKRGEDIDPETGILHAAHLMCCAAMLAQYYFTYPQGDDRPTSLMKPASNGTEVAIPQSD